MNKLLMGLLVIGILLNGFPTKITSASLNYGINNNIVEPWDKGAHKHFTDPLFEQISICESGGKLDAKNPNSTASGEFQFINSTWIHYAKMYWGEEWINKDKFSEYNRELAWFVYVHYGTSDWEADQKSYNCWKHKIPEAVYKNIK